jgi:cyclic pyranopterin phosphate synthase
MPEEGIEWQERSQILTLEEIERLATVFAKLGVDKIRLTGGEPTVRKGYLQLIATLKNIQGIEKILLTTNGSSLAKHAQSLKENGLTGINISLDTLRRDRFEQITRRDEFDRVMAGIQAAVDAKFDSIKLNVVSLSGVNEDEIVDFVEFVKDKPIQVRFIEFMPFLGNEWKADRVLGYAEMRRIIEQKFALIPMPGQPTDVAKDFRIEGHQGMVGFVTSVTDSFCDGCNRIRLTSDGQLKTCLFLPPKSSLRDLMRSGCEDEDLVHAIRSDLFTKWAGHPPMNTWRQLDTLAMVEIGG